MTKPTKSLVAEALAETIMFTRDEEIERYSNIIYAFLDDVQQLVQKKISGKNEKRQWLTAIGFTRNAVYKLSELARANGENNG